MTEIEVVDAFGVGVPDTDDAGPETALSGAEHMLLSGGPIEGLEEAILGDGAEAEEGMDESEAAEPSTGRVNQLRRAWARREDAVCAARRERRILERRVHTLDRQLVDVLRPRLRTAKARGDLDEARRLDDKIHRLDLARGIAAARAIRYAKTEALGTLLSRNARTQANLLELARRASQAGKPAEGQTLQRAAQQIGEKTERYKTLRRQQVHKWRAQTAASRAALARMLREQAEHRLTTMEERAHARPVQAGLAKRAAEHRLLIRKLRDTESRERARLQHLGVDEAAADTATAADTAELAAFMELEGLDGIWSSLKTFAKKAGGAVTSPAKKLGGSIKSAIANIGAAAGSLGKKAACGITTNPAVQQAAMAAGSAHPAGIAAAIGTQLVAGACGGGSGAPAAAPAAAGAAQTGQPFVFTAATAPVAAPSGGPASQPGGSRLPVTPVLIGGGVAAAGLAAVLLMKR